jgi:Na+/H+ antiporter NhaC
MPDYGWWSILPPIAAIVLAIATRRIYASLAAGVLMGVTIMAWPSSGSWLELGKTVISSTAEGHLWPSLSEPKFLRIVAFTLLIGAMVGIVQASGGMRGILKLLLPLARTRVGGQLVAFALGLIVFIDDYANTLLIGPTLRPLFDRLRISREKLAYIVDSTSAPVAGLALVSTWVAGEMDYIQQGFQQVGVTCNPFELFVASLPYRCYEILALLLVALLASMGRDFGPMLDAERMAARGELTYGGEYEDELLPEETEPNRWYNALIPILLTIGAVVVLLSLTSNAQPAEDGGTSSGWRWWAEQLGQGDSYIALLYGALLGLVAAMGLAKLTGIRWEQIRYSAMEGAIHVLPALAILWLARALGTLCGDEHLRTGVLISDGLKHLQVGAAAMPLVTFLVASLISLATGTSWGTMGLVTPLAIGVTFGLLQADSAAGPAPDHPLLLATIGAVLAGAIFGDHCSPISDTTILSSRSSMCDHIQHVRTQLPYAGLAAMVSILLMIGFGLEIPPSIALPVGCVMLTAAVWFLGKPVGPVVHGASGQNA